MTKLILALALALWLLLAPVSAFAQRAPAPAQNVVVTADRMIDVLSGRVVEEPVVVITDGRIVSVVGRGGARPLIPEGARRIDLPGMTILPGLIDMHVHLDSSPYYGPYDSLQFTDLFQTVMGPGHARDMLEAGFTTVRNVGSDHYADVAYMQAIDEGRIAGAADRARRSCALRDRRPLRRDLPAARLSPPGRRASPTGRRRSATGCARCGATARR